MFVSACDAMENFDYDQISSFFFCLCSIFKGPKQTFEGPSIEITNFQFLGILWLTLS